MQVTRTDTQAVDGAAAAADPLAAWVGYDHGFPDAAQEPQALPQANLLLMGRGLAVFEAVTIG